MKVNSTTVLQLIKEGAKLGKREVKVTFYAAYDKRVHSTLPNRLKDELKKQKVSVFDIIMEGQEIVALTKSSDVKKMEWR